MFAGLMDGATIIRLPFTVFPYDDTDGHPGLMWTTERLLGLTPLVGARSEVVGDLYVPPYQRVILIGPRDELGCQLITSVPMTDADRAWITSKRAEIERAYGPTAAAQPSTDDFRWHVRSLMIGFCGSIGAPPLGTATEFYVGSRVMSAEPEMHLFLSMEPEADAATARAAKIPREYLVPTAAAAQHAAAEIMRQALGEHAVVSRKEQSAQLAAMPSESLARIIISHVWDIDALMRTAVTAFSLLSAKNVQLELVEPAPQSRAARRRGDRPPLRFHVLKVKPLVRRRAGAPGGIHEEPVAIHWVRGHLKHYTAERPLFGRFVGTYYWQAHLAGRDKEHRVEKSYEIAAAPPAGGGNR